MIIAQKYWLRRLKRQGRQKLDYSKWDNVSCLGVVACKSTAGIEEDVQSFIHSMKSVGIETHVLYLSKDRISKKELENRSPSTLYRNERNWKGVPEGGELNAFVQRKYDAVLHLCTGVEGLSEYLPYLVEAGLLVGPRHYEDDVMDIEIEMKDRSTQVIFEDAVNWLKKIRNVA